VTERHPIRRTLLVAALLVAAAAAGAYAIPSNWVVGGYDTDLIKQFMAWRAFAAQTLLSGHLPLWNPYTYSGQPFLGGFQSALLYPPNAVFLVLPLARAVNFSMFGHLLLLGWGMHRLASRRGLHPLAAWVCAAVLPLSGAVFPHLFAGHLSNVCSMAWAPWIFLGIEDFHRGPGIGGLILASAAACLQILAGHVQYVFYTAIAAGVQALVLTLCDGSLRRRALPGVAILYAAAALLAAAQLFPGLASLEQGVRHARLGFDFASMFSFPVENLITSVVPGFFGDLAGHPYWGRGYLWEMSVFTGVSGMALAAVALLDSDRKREARIDLVIAGLLLLLGLGNHTPLFRVLYEHVPGFDRFRGVSKFTFPATLFLVLAIGTGADAIIRGKVPRRTLGICAVQAGILAGIAGACLLNHPMLLSGFIAEAHATVESYLRADVAADPKFLRLAGLQAGSSLVHAGIVLFIAGAAILGAARRPILRWVPLALLPLELAGFATTHFAASSSDLVLPKGLKPFVANHPGNYRVLDAADVNNGFLLGAPDIWGDDPGVLRRYAEFISATQGTNPDETTQFATFRKIPSVYAMLRFRYSFLPSKQGTVVTEQVKKPMDEVQLISDYRVIPGRNDIFTALAKAGFDPRKTVILESLPLPRPVPSDHPGTVRITGSAPDWMTITADIESPTLLLVTDTYSRGWHAWPMANSVQEAYDVLPANYVLRAIPLAPGHHEIRLEYSPGGFIVGIVVSIAAWLGWLLVIFRRRLLHHGAP